MIALFGTYVPDNMRTLLFSLSVLLLAACSTTRLPISPHKIDVQQGNVIDQETVDKLKPGLTRSQVRFLLGTPLVVDPFRDSRWDYVYNYRTAGKLTAHSRLTLYFDRDVLSRIEVDGLQQPSVKADVPAGGEVTSQVSPATIAVPEPQPQAQTAAVPTEAPAKPAMAAGAVTEAAPAKPAPQAEQVRPAPPVPVAASPVAASTNAVTVAPTKPVAEAQAAPKAAAAGTLAAPKPAVTESAARTKTSVVPPLEPLPAKPATVPATIATPQAPQSVTLQSETDPAAIKPDTMPAFPEPPATPDTESPVLAAVQTWAKAWSARDEQGYLAAYAHDFKPAGGFTRAEWEKRRRMLLSLSKNIDVRVESPVVEFPAEGRALVTFNQNYSSDSYHDAVIKQLLMGLQDGHWLILEERVMPAPRVKQP